MRLWASRQLADGDTVQIDACTYTNDFNPANTGTNDVTIYANNVNISAVKSSSPSCVVPDPWDGANPSHPAMAMITLSPCPSPTYTGCPGVAKGLWNVHGSGMTIDHIAFVGAYNDAKAGVNAGGLRLENATGLTTLSNDYFGRNQMGLFVGVVGTPDLLIKNSEFAGNGVGCVLACTHQVYLQGNSVTVQNSYFHDPNQVVNPSANGHGHQIKSRALSTTITETRIFDNAKTASFDINIPQGGNIDVENNVIQKGPHAENTYMMDTGWNGADQPMHPTNGMTVVGNTFVNDYTKGVIAVHNGYRSSSVTISNNTFIGVTPGQVHDGGPAMHSGNTFTTTRPALDTSSPISGMVQRRP